MTLRWHMHPQSNCRVYGTLLEDGVTLETNDVYDSTSGRWENCPSPGGTLHAGGDSHVIWVRPCPVPKEVSGG